jgi:hypothetical protein
VYTPGNQSHSFYAAFSDEKLMKFFGILSLLIGLGIAAWLAVNQQKPGGEMSQTTAEAAVQSGKRSQGKAQILTVQSAVRSFQAVEGRLPRSLAELEEKEYLDRLPSGVDYDAGTGQVTLSE